MGRACRCGCSTPRWGTSSGSLDIYTPLPVDFAIHGASGQEAVASTGGAVAAGKTWRASGEAEAPPREPGRRDGTPPEARSKADEGTWFGRGAGSTWRPMSRRSSRWWRWFRSAAEGDRASAQAGSGRGASTTWVADAHHAALVQPTLRAGGRSGQRQEHLSCAIWRLCWAGETLRAAGDTPPHSGRRAGRVGLAGPDRLTRRSTWNCARLIAGDAWALDADRRSARRPELREYLRARLTPEGCEACVDDLFDLLRGRSGGDPAGWVG